MKDLLVFIDFLRCMWGLKLVDRDLNDAAFWTLDVNGAILLRFAI